MLLTAHLLLVFLPAAWRSVMRGAVHHLLRHVGQQPASASPSRACVATLQVGAGVPKEQLFDCITVILSYQVSGRGLRTQGQAGTVASPPSCYARRGAGACTEGASGAQVHDHRPGCTG